MCAPDQGAVHAAGLDDLPEPLKAVAASSEALALLIDGISESFRDDLAEIAEGLAASLGVVLEQAAEGGTFTAEAEALSRAIAAGDLSVLLDEAGFTAAIDGLMEQYSTVLAGAVDTFEAAGLPRSALSLDLSLLESLAAREESRWLLYGDDMALVAKRAILGSVFEGTTLSDTVDMIVEQMGATLADATRDARTFVNGYARNVQSHIAEVAGLKHFLYVGPLDKITRPFCRPLVGKVLTEKQVGELRNGQIEPVITYAGGFSCRHHFNPVPPPSDAAPWPTATSEDVNKAGETARKRDEREAS